MLGKSERIEKLVHIKRLIGKVLAYLNILLDSKIRHEVVELEYKAEVCLSVLCQSISL